jgi:hypothetical protein
MPQEPAQLLTLLRCWMEIVQPWRAIFVQQRTWVRATRQALGGLLVLGRATLSRILWTNGRAQKAWSGEYFLHSRAAWDPQALFAPLLEQCLAFCPGKLVGVAVDDTRLRKTGRSIPQAAWHRDPMSPPFHTNLMLGLRFLQASLRWTWGGGYYAMGFPGERFIFPFDNTGECPIFVLAFDAAEELAVGTCGFDFDGAVGVGGTF